MSTMATNTTKDAPTPAAPPDPSASTPSGREQLDETVLADDVLELVKEIALDELPGGTIVGIEADADGAGYVAHMLNAEGIPLTVYVDATFDFVELG